MRGLPDLVGSRVSLRPFVPDRLRAAAHRRWRNDVDVMRWHYLRPRTAVRDELARIRTLLESPLDWAWDIFVRGAPDHEVEHHVGYVIVHRAVPSHRHGELTITIGERAAWGRGVGREALELVLDRAFSRDGGLHRAFLTVAAPNERAIRCYRSLGFVEEGRRREHLLVDGRFVDDLVMPVLDREWHARHLAVARAVGAVEKEGP